MRSRSLSRSMSMANNTPDSEVLELKERCCIQELLRVMWMLLCVPPETSSAWSN